MTNKNRKQKKKEAPAPPTTTQSPADLLKEKGDKAYKENKYDDAVSFYSQAIEVDAKKETLYSNRSAAYIAKSEWQAALKDAEKAIELKPDWCKGYFRKGQAYAGMMQPGDAATAYKKGLEKDPNDPALKKAMEEIHEMMEELKMSEKELMAQSKENPEQDRFQQMINWLKAGGGQFPYLYLQYYSADYRGVHALTKIPNNKIILEVPLDMIMTSDIAKASDIGKKIISSGCRLSSEHSYLASYLLQEKHNPNSKWQPYIRILPQHYRNMPIFFDEEELSWLKGSFSLQKIDDRKEELKEEYDNICNHVPEFRRFKHEEFVWARLAVITRIFGLEIKGQKTDGLVPMADMLNHKRPNETSWTFDDSRMAFTITTLKPMARGDQIYDSYGRKCNSRFFVNYGFSLDVNEDNQVAMFFSLPDNDPQYQMKLRLLGGRGATNRRFQIPIDWKEKVTKECFSFLRFAHAKDSELMLLSSAEEFNVKEIEPISIRNEIEVIKHVAQVAAEVLSGFDCDIEGDNKLLNDPNSPLDMNHRNAVLMRRGEKEVLHYYIDLAKEIIPLMSKPWKDFKKDAAKCFSGKGRFDSYITGVLVPLFKNEK